jgi:putative ABC transport system ATP-binding protein
MGSIESTLKDRVASHMLKLENISKTYQTSHVETHALEDVSLEVRAGEFLAIMGPSGCGKSTLLAILGMLDNPTRGAYRFLGEDVAAASEGRLTALRRSSIGFIFQSFNLIDDLSVAENIEVALIYRNVAAAERKRRVSAILERVGMAARARHFPQQLSGGQQQRVAIARAVVANPKLILADEPTGNLDSTNGDAVMGLLTEIADEGTTIIMVTHSLSQAGIAKRTVKLLDGHVVSETVLGE